MKLNPSFFKQLTHRRHTRETRSVHRLLNPTREWITSLMVAFVVACGLVGHAGWEFYEQSGDNAMPEVSAESIPRYRAVDAELLIRYYEGRETTWNERVGNTVVEPPVVEETQVPVTEEVADEERVVPTEIPKME